jgi:uncharacterized membrane protein YhiD involved in acid resistance
MSSQISFNDIFKSSFMDKVSSFSILDTGIALAVSFAIGLFIFLVYKKTFKGVMYSSSFGVSLIVMCLTTTFIIIGITSNVVLSLGMVGALSIVRFRTAVKEPMDIAFLFWAISVGIISGAGLIPLAVIGSLFIGIIILVFANRNTNESPYILVVNMNNQDSEDEIMSYIGRKVKKQVIKSKTVSNGLIEMTFEIRLKKESTNFVNEISKMEGVNNAALVSYNGEYMS